jgi:hypothetical protein
MLTTVVSPLTNTLLSLVSFSREYPSLLEDRDEDGVLIKERPALDWPDYFLGSVDKDGMTKGERVLYEFWVRGMFFC